MFKTTTIPHKQATSAEIIAGLRNDLLLLQGVNTTNSTSLDLGLGPIIHAFPNASFPLGALHEFLADKAEDIAATSGFLAGLLSALTGDHGTVLWISTSRKLFPPALKTFGIIPDHFIFVDLKKEKDVLWVMDEALKCGALAAVVGELREISFTESRRLQLAVEKSQVTGFIVRKNFKSWSTTACVSRWKISSLPSEQIEDLPGVGSPKWRINLSKVRNGKSGIWDLQWRGGRFVPVYQFQSPMLTSQETAQQRKAG